MVDLRQLFVQAGFHGTNPIADHYLTLSAISSGGMDILFDADGAGSGPAVKITSLDHVLPTSLQLLWHD